MISLSTAVGTVQLKEAWQGYRRGRSASEGRQIVKNYILGKADWPKIDAVIDALMGTAATSGGLGGSITRRLPHQCPEDNRLYCHDAWFLEGAEQDLKDSGRPTFDNATIQATYGFLPYTINPLDDPNGLIGFPNSDSPGTPYTYAIQEVKGGTEMIRLPNSGFKWASDNKPAVDSVGRFIGNGSFIFVRKRVPYLNEPLYLSLQNKLNDRVMFGAPIGQFRFHNWGTRTEFNDDGTRSNEVTFDFRWREFDWNKFMRPDGNTFDFLVDGSANKVYSYADLRPLFTQ